MASSLCCATRALGEISLTWPSRNAGGACSKWVPRTSSIGTMEKNSPELVQISNWMAATKPSQRWVFLINDEFKQMHRGDRGWREHTLIKNGATFVAGLSPFKRSAVRGVGS